MKYIALILITTLAIACGNTNGTVSSSNENQQQPTVKNLAQSDLASKITEDVILIDVRTPGEVNAGYIDGADAFIDYNGASFQSEINKLDKEKTYVMYCRSGGRSGRAAEFMVKNGFKDVYNLEGGILAYKGELKTE